MVKKIVVDEAQLSRIVISGAGHGKNIFPVAPQNGDSFSSLSRGRSGKRTGDEMTDEDVTDVAATEQTTLADIDGSASEQLILLAKTDINLPPTPNTAPVTVVQKGIELFGSNASNWVGGVGLAAVGTGVGLAFYSNNANDPVSAISDSNVAPNSVAENAGNGTDVGITALATDAGATISYSLSDDAGGRFAIDATTGVITVADGSLLDYESATSHAVTVLATSSDGSTSSQQFTINLSNVNDNPVSAISDSNVAANAVDENAAAGTVVGITALATDADADTTISYSLSDNAGGRFAIDATTGVITVADGTLLDFESATSHDLTVLATSSDGSTNSQQFTVDLSNVNEPVSSIKDSDVAADAVIENAVNGTLVGITALATDPDAGTTISYSLSDNAGGRFAIDATSGVITVADGALLDFAIAPSHVVTVLATSSDGSINSQPFTIDLINVIAPVLAISASSVANNVSTGDLNLAGFSADDRIEIDSQTFIANDHNALNILSNTLSRGDNTHAMISHFVPSLSSFKHTGAYYSNSNSYAGASNLQLASGLPTDSPLQDIVDFVNLPVHQEPFNVVVDDQAGNVATFSDANANGVRNIGEDTHALLSQTPADVDAFNAVAGISHGSQAVDLPSEQVSIHDNDVPTGAWVPDMTGFNGHDRIEIDVAATLNNLTANDTMSLNNQSLRSMDSQTQFHADAPGVSSGNMAGNFGPRATTTSFTGTVINIPYAATGTLQGVIASNADTMANNFQQVVFVTPII